MANDSSTKNSTYYDGDLRADLLAAAREAITTNGLSTVSLRGLARVVGVSHAAPAHHFVDKRGLFTALATAGFHMFTDLIEEAMAEAEQDPVARLLAMGEAYTSFAIKNPASFEVMFRSEIIDTSNPDYGVAADRAFSALYSAVEAAMDSGWAAGEDLGEIVLLVWSVVHGFAVLGNFGTLKVLGDDNDLGSSATVLLESLARAYSSS